MSAAGNSKQLRRTITPYVGQGSVLILVTAGLLIYSIRVNDFGFTLPAVVAWLAFSVLIYIGLKYRISWTDEELCQEASGGANICIKYSQITDIKRESARINQMISMSSPYRRIAINGVSGHKLKHINLSLRHFRDEDIRELLTFIRGRRPDLILPEGAT